VIVPTAAAAPVQLGQFESNFVVLQRSKSPETVGNGRKCHLNVRRLED
jgi:hypothetical protein